MIPQFIVSGTDTGLGKTLLSSLLVASLPTYNYWKPIQSGMDGETDSELVLRQSGCSPERILQEAYLLTQPLSPHRSAKIDGKEITLRKLDIPTTSNLIIEGAGGVLVPLNDSELMIDLFRMWQLPVLLAIRSKLGTINHSLLTLEALRARKIPVLGCVAIGPINPANEEAVGQFGNVEIVGRIPRLRTISPDTLRSVWDKHFAPFSEKLNSSRIEYK